MQLRYFRCPSGRNTMTAPKRGNNSEKKHRKHMYCPFCKDIRKFTMTENVVLRVR